MTRAVLDLFGDLTRSRGAGRVASLAFVVLMFALVIFFALRVIPKAERPILGPPPQSTAPHRATSSASPRPGAGSS